MITALNTASQPLKFNCGRVRRRKVSYAPAQGALGKAMFMVIFGAGASYDSVASRRPSEYPRGALLSRPPLARELFLPEDVFAESLSRYPQCNPIVPYLQTGENLEHTLEALQAEAETDPERKR